MRQSPTRLPAVFFGHGSPMNALERNRYTRAWEEVGRRIVHPRAILCVSAHWFTRGTAITAMQQPKTIHDFGGFPQALYDVRYPAPGDSLLASRVKELLAPTSVFEDLSEWGLDHGTWSVLKHMYPDADIPVVQLSIDATRSLPDHYALARRLMPLREEGVLVVGSGNVVHNLRVASFGPESIPVDWAVRFNEHVRDRLLANDHQSLADMASLGDDGAKSIPTPEHYLPLLYVIALQQPGETLSFLTDGIVAGSISMMSVSIGETISSQM